ncbi:AAA family ATPase [Aliarcobacter butzleri]|uniref:AAA family ATPase n=1 Tax=Aliarcobacter butzleri TaxID=28197 RepID=UPI00263EF6F5|nr:ATP-binding protein [Aliarcobacter butzleri]MDN5079944.1 AAA family ATPase [Aliarcobacter butzleri]
MSIIKEITIQGFKSILDQKLELAQMNVFIGTNGAGKSNLLEALAMVSSSAEGGISYYNLERKGSRLSSPEIFRSSFKNKTRKGSFKIEIKMDDYIYDMKINSTSEFSYFTEQFSKNNKKIAGRSRAGSTLLSNSINKLEKDKSILGVLQSFEDDYSSIINSLKNFAIYSPSTPILRGVSEDSYSLQPLGLYGGGLAKALSEVIRDYKEDDSELQRFFHLFDWFHSIGTTNTPNLEVLPGQNLFGNIVVKYKDKFMSTKFNELYAYDVSEGALFILFVLVLLIHKKSPNIFALDNIDNTLNPGLVKKLMMHLTEILKEHPEKQIFLTTHNPTALDAIDLFNENHRLFVVSRSKSGETTIERIKPPENTTKEDWENEYFGLKLSEIWLSGAIGGLPKGF